MFGELKATPSCCLSYSLFSAKLQVCGTVNGHNKRRATLLLFLLLKMPMSVTNRRAQSSLHAWTTLFSTCNRCLLKHNVVSLASSPTVYRRKRLVWSHRDRAQGSVLRSEEIIYITNESYLKRLAEGHPQTTHSKLTAWIFISLSELAKPVAHLT